ncbi:hypothetical protein ACFE04_005966 [Oxalis oulophora]
MREEGYRVVGGGGGGSTSFLLFGVCDDEDTIRRRVTASGQREGHGWERTVGEDSCKSRLLGKAGARLGRGTAGQRLEREGCWTAEQRWERLRWRRAAVYGWVTSLMMMGLDSGDGFAMKEKRGTAC